MDAELMSWKNEMENMLAAINRQTTHSLRVIRLIFKRCGRSLPPDFKQIFLQVTSKSIKTTYDQFEIDLLLEESMGINLNSVANVVGGSSNDRQSGLTSGASNGQQDIQTDNLDDEEVVIEKEESERTQFSSSIAIDCDDLYGINESIAHQSNTDEGCIAHPKDNVVLEIDESNDSIEMVENQSDSTDADDNELIPMNVGSHRLKETAIGLIEDNVKMVRLDTKKSNRKRITATTRMNKDWDNVVTKGEKSAPKRLTSKNQKRCSVCGYTAFHTGTFNRHLRTHTGERPYECDRCGKSFTNAQTLMKHAITHIKDFPFHCRTCFQGFSLKTEVTDHEKHCKKRRYECHLCKTFVTGVKTQLIIHMRKHTGDKPFCCAICMKHFRRTQHLKRHLNTIHYRL